MYSISLIQGNDNLIIYNDLHPNAKYVKLINPELDMKVNTAGTLTFTMPPSNVGYNIIKPITSTVRVFRDGKWLWTGRPITISSDFWKQKKVVCEGALAFLNDIVAPLHKYTGITATDYIKQLLNIYQDRLTRYGAARIPYRMFSLNPIITYETVGHNPIGTVDYVTEDDSILSYIKKFADDYGLYIRLKEIQVVNDGTYSGQAFQLELVNDYQLNTCEQEINFGKNLLDYSDNYEWSDIVTVLHPIGAKLDTIGKTGDEDYPDHLTLATSSTSNPSMGSNVGSGIAEEGDGIIEVSSGNSYIGTLSDDEDDEDDPTLDTQSSLSNDEDDENDGNDPALDEQSPVSDDEGDEDDEDDPTLDAQSSSPFAVMGEYLINVSAMTIFGRIEETVTWSEIDDRETLRTFAELYLSDYQYDGMKLTVKVMDLHYLSPAIKTIDFLSRVNCISKPHNMNTTFVATEIKIPFDKPENTTISFSRNQGNYKSDSSSSISTSKSSNLSDFASKIISKNEVMKEARDHAAAMMDMHTNGYVSFIAPIDSDDPNFPVADKDRSDRVGEIWITDNINPDYAFNRWRWNVNGLAHQTRETIGDEWSSPNVAITMDGSIVASYITTGLLVIPNGTVVNPRTQPAIWDVTQPFAYNDPRILFRADMTNGKCSIANLEVDPYGLHTPGKISARSSYYGTFIGSYDPVNDYPAVISVGNNVNYGQLNAGSLELGQMREPQGEYLTIYNKFKIDTDSLYDGVLVWSDSIVYLNVDALAVGYGDNTANYTTGLTQSVNVGGMYLRFHHGICIGAFSSSGGGSGDDGIIET